MRNLILISTALLALGLGVWLGWRVQFPAPPVTQTATLYPQPRPLQAFSLTDQRGQPLTLEQIKGRWTLWFFGYTHRPDICPLKLSVMRQVYAALQRDRPDLLPLLTTVFVSVDPERDDVAKLAQYTAFFDPRITGATGTPEALAALARQMGIVYLRTQNADNAASGAYQMDHSAAMLLTDPQARLYAVFGAQADAAGITQDLVAILR